jgi:hypothetical protein
MSGPNLRLIYVERERERERERESAHACVREILPYFG